MVDEINTNLDKTPLPPNNLVAKDPQSAEIAGYVRTKTFGREVREAIARSIELNSTRSKSAEILANETVNVANDLTDRFNQQIGALTEDSEVIDARGGKATLGQRLDVDKADLLGGLSTLQKELTSANNFAQQQSARITERGLSVLEMGAKADGVTDDGPAINAAIEAVRKEEVNTRTVYIPAGKYLINTELKIAGWGINIVGDGRYSELIAGDQLDRALLSSLYDDRKEIYGGTDYTSALSNVVIDSVGFYGNERSLYGLLIDGFERGCQIKNCFIKGFGHVAIAINGSWCFALKDNVIEGIYKPGGQHFGKGIVFGDQSVPAHYVAYNVNAPQVTGNSIQYCEVGFKWVRGMGGIISGNTFEGCKTRLVDFEYASGFTYSGNYHEQCFGAHSVKLGAESDEGRMVGVVISGNSFEKLQTGQSAHFIIVGMERCTIANNFFTNTNDRQAVVASNFNSSKSIGNIINLIRSKIYDYEKIDIQKNKIYWDNPL